MNNFSFPENFKDLHIHFVGIKGTGMVALVEVLVARGAKVTGSDVSERFYTDEILDKLSIKALPFSEENITDDTALVIYSSAYNPEKTPDLKSAVKKGVPCMLYSEALGAYSERSYSAGVCGVHGKTTTTGLCGTLIKAVNLPSQALAGSIISSFGNSCTMNNQVEGKSKYFIAETCEYQRHFMSFCPQKIILTSVESDHQDYYPTYEDIRNAFVDYICKLPQNGQLIYCADDDGAVETAKLALEKHSDIVLIPYGEKASGDYKLTFGKVENGKQKFSLSGFDDDFEIQVPGLHNVRNASAAIALTVELLKTDGKNPLDYIENIKNGLMQFAGGKRRSEILKRAKTPAGQEVIFIDDYGHHPTAIKTTLAGFRSFYGKHKIIVDFMSHTYTRTAALLEEFASSFESADVVILNKIYGSAREDASAAKVTGETLAQRAATYHNNVNYAKEFDEAAQLGLKLLSEPSGEKYSEGYIFVTMGAGDNWKVASKIMEKLEE